MGPSLKAWERVCSLARIKVSAFEAGDHGFKSHRIRQYVVESEDSCLFHLLDTFL